ncbi:MAG: MBL fold metallo-hydrolase [Holosporaceae bacterium]|nr:MBL fold metallo-hydrolase [Holosporaceae bacterium]
MVSDPASKDQTLCAFGINEGLHIFAFDVGQANFIVLAKDVNHDGVVNRHLAIVDAGWGAGKPGFPLYENKMIPLFEAENAILDAVFVTHPHTDHYNAFIEGPVRGVLERLVEKSASNKEGGKVPFYLGGTDADWENGKCSNFVGNVSSKGGSPVYMESYRNDPTLLFDEVFFQILPVIKPTSGGNKLSQPILVWENEENKILFTGDAESDSLDRLQGNSHNLLQLYRLLALTNPVFFSDAEKDFMDECSVDLVQAEDSDGLFTAFAQLGSGAYWHLYELAEKTGRVVPVDDLILGYASKILPNLEYSLNNLGVRSTSEQDIAIYNTPLNQLFMGVISGLLIEDDNFFLSRIRPLLISFIKKDQELKQLFCTHLGKESLTKRDIESVLDAYRAHEDVRPILNAIIIQEFLENVHFLANDRVDFLRKVIDCIPGKYDTFWRICGFDNINAIKNIIFNEYLLLLQRRESFYKGVRTVFLPHHGSNSENSQRFLGYFAANPNDRIFVVSSAPFAGKRLPKRSTWEMAPEFPIQLDHPFLYAKDDADLDVLGDNSFLQVTTKPIYLTSASPIGVFCLKVRGGDIFILDTHFRGDDSPFKWVNASDRSILQ